MLHSILTLSPLFVVTISTIIFILEYKILNKAQRSLILYGLVAIAYHLLSAYFMFNGLSPWMISPWSLTVQSLAPLGFITIYLYTSADQRIKWPTYLLFLPAVATAIIDYFVPSYFSSIVDNSIYNANTLLCYGLAVYRLYYFEKDIRNGYADIKDRSSRPLRILILCMMIFAIAVFILNFTSIYELTKVQLYSILMCSAIFRFALFYIIKTYSFTVKELTQDMGEDIPGYKYIDQLEEEKAADENYLAELEKKIDKLMDEERTFRILDVTIADVALKVYSNRTYVSRCINQRKGVSFSEFINSKRISYAEQLLADEPGIHLSNLAMASGFSSDQTFLVNYRRFTGKAFKRNKVERNN